MSQDYKDTVFLPRTDFPMRAGLKDKEPEILAKWEAMDLYAALRTQSKGGKNSSCTMARPMPTAISTLAMR